MESAQYTRLFSTVQKLIDGYATTYQQVWENQDWKNPFRDMIATELPSLLKDCAHIQEPYKVTGSYGKGRWTEVPWIAIFDTRLTTSAQKGVYIVYLLNKNTKSLYLTLEAAVTEALGKTDPSDRRSFISVAGKNTKELQQQLQNKVAQIRSVIPSRYFQADRKINSGSVGYDSGAIYYRKYTLSTLPSGEELTSDLLKMLELYRQYYEWAAKGFPSIASTSVPTVAVSDDTTPPEDPPETTEEPPPVPDPITVPEEPPMLPTSEILPHISRYLLSRGFTYPAGLVENFYLSLKSKPFVILAGTSGTGKTRLVRLFAEAIGAAFHLVPVRPDWSDGSDLFGHTDLNGRFIPGPVCAAFDAAFADPSRPVLLCLDEMNLARVEYYLSDYLSVIESRRWQDGHIVTDPIAHYPKGIPENLYLVGTVNMDETTFPFSKKVLDRANTIEFNYVDLTPHFPSEPQEDCQPLSLPNAFLRSDHLILATDCREEELVEEICEKLQQLNQLLLKANAHIGYRVRDEVVFYLLNNEQAERPLTPDAAFDNEILQKILPRLQGSSNALKRLLLELFRFCINSHSAIDPDQRELGAQMRTMAEGTNVPYPASAKKLSYMMTRFEDDGFTSYWL